MLKIIFIVFIIILLNSFSLLSQTQQDLFQQMMRAFQNLKFENAEKIAKQITADYESHTLSELVEAHKILGVIAYQRDMNLQEAQLQFEQALSIDRKVQLDSVYASIKTIGFFNDIKSKFISRPVYNEVEQNIHYRYLIQPDPRPGATLRSMVLPGWGQFYKNDKTKGYIFITSTATFALTTTLFHFMQKNAHDDYLKATEPGVIEQKYDKYNRFYKLRNNVAIATAGIWLYAFFDALIAEPKPANKPVKISFAVDKHPSICAQIFF